MTAVARYVLADYMRSQRYLPQLVSYLGFLAIFYAFPGTALPGYGASAAALLPISVWLALSLHNTEDPLQAAVTIVNAGSRWRVTIGKTSAALAGVLALSGIAVIWPMVSSGMLHTPTDLAVGLFAHLTCGITGVALGTCCTRPIIKRQGYAFATALLLGLIALVSRLLSPANQTIRLLSGAPPRPSFTELLLLMGWALIMLVALTSMSSWLAQRRR
ncbi:hypothetical protein [Streptomyces sp. AcE210]|uniref:hypothetical protein n=1 Tax=Streptomyces sp. AcE210 TaxID=2292703 RepID=UPI000E301374|nr:hypothetical protein [Streptomyces sp. AcE210]RFC77335.1 hypothetical protein DXZ75_05020 [Streptomyces sp. AcE210]